MVRSVKRRSEDSSRSQVTAKKGSQLKPTGESQKQKPKLTNVILDVGCNDDDEDDGSFFKNFLKSKGFSFEKDEIRFTSEEDQVVFQKDFQISLKSHKNYPQVVDLFVDGFESFIIENNRFIHCLVPISQSMSDETVSPSKCCESLAKLLLGIDMLQAKIINCLIEKLALLSYKDGSVSCNYQGRNLDIAQLIINQFRWLNHIVEEKVLVSKLFEVISVSELEIQRMLILCLPELISDSKHAEVCQQLMEILQQNSQLTASVIEALTSLNLAGSLLTEVRQSVLDILDSANMEDCPACVRFILQSIGDEDCVQVIGALRSRLVFEEENLYNAPGFCSAAREKQTEYRDNESLILDFIKLAIRFQKSVASGWLKVIESVNDPAQGKVLDLYALVVIHGITNKKKSVESLLRQKLKSNALSKTLVTKAFTSHSQAFIDLFKDVLSIAETLFRSPEIVISKFGSKIYEQAFVNFDTYCQQEVIATLITHIGSGLENDIDSAFDVLSQLVAAYPDKMSQFAIFLKGILDHLNNLTISQMRRLFSMISSIVIQHTKSGTVFEDDMHILIRKRMSNPSLKNRRVGIIGSVMIAASMSKKGFVSKGDENLNSSNFPATSNYLETGAIKELTNLLEMTRTCASKDPEAAALFYDELSAVVAEKQVHPKILQWITETVSESFQDAFVIATDDFKSTNNLELLFNIEEESSIAINLFPLLLNDLQDEQRLCSSSSSVMKTSAITYMSPLFRLLAICESVSNDGNLEEIEALLESWITSTGHGTAVKGCPLILFGAENLQKLNSVHAADKELICKGLFFTINWLREVVNAFADQDDPSIRGKVICRIETIASLGEILNKVLPALPNFIPPRAVFDAEDTPVKALQISNTCKGKRKRKAQRKDIADKEFSNASLKEKCTENEKDIVSEDKAEDSIDLGPVFQWWNYRCFLREFDMKAFKVLQYGSVSKNVLDSEMNTKETEIISLTPASLQMLLKDLECKALYALPSSKAVRKSLLKRNANKDIGFSRLSQLPSTQAAEMFIDLVPYLCSNLEEINAHFQCVQAKPDGHIVTCNNDWEDQRDAMLSSFQSILSCFNRIVSWDHLKDTACTSHLKTFLMHIACRIQSFDKDEATIPTLLRVVVHYFAELCSNASSLLITVLVLKILDALQGLDESENTKTTIFTIADKSLRKEWVNEENWNRLLYNEALTNITKLHLDTSTKALDVLEQYITFLGDFLDQGACRSALPCLNKNTFSIFYKVLSEHLPLVMKRDLSCKSNTVLESESLQILDSTKCCVKIFNSLTGFVKVVETRSVLGSALKNGRRFLEAFLKYCMPILDLTLKKNKEEVHGILKNLQQSTRSLHHFCGHSKVVQDMTLTGHVPLTKKFLEIFVFRVKAMLAVNQCHSAFWLGNLKNRDFHGNELNSQTSFNETEEEITVEEEVIEHGQEKETDDESCSESF